MPDTPLSPKQVADALGVSESSLKRWCDKGLLTPFRTAGGHRKLHASQVVQFVRQTGHGFAKPELVGLPRNSQARRGKVEIQALYEALAAGQQQLVRELLFQALLEPRSILEIGDELLAPAFHAIGDAWHSGKLDVYQERRACELCLGVLHEIRHFLPPAAVDAPVAIGGGLSGDNAALPGTLVELTLRELGWKADWLGPNLPLESLAQAIRDTEPQLIWISVCHLTDADQVCSAVNHLFELAAAQGAALLLGGRAITPQMRQQMRYTAFCDRLQHGVSFAKSTHLARPANSTGL